MNASIDPESLETVSAEVCIDDVTFDWTEKSNDYFADNLTAKNVFGSIS